MTAPALEARGLEKRFGAVAAARAVDVAVAAGERVGVIGANGAGKTTFVNMVTGYLKPDGGTILHDGRAIDGLEPRQVARLGVRRSFQVPQIFPALTAFDNMLVAVGAARPGRPGFWRPLRDDATAAGAAAALARFGLETHAERIAGELPQGLRKLLDIAMALAGETRVLLLDEPTSGVSADEKGAVMDTVAEALAEGTAAALFVEHDMEVVERYAARVVAFYDGRVIADGPTGEVLADADVRRHVVGPELHRRA